MEEEDPREGAILADRYRIAERLASGGMGAVYRATQIALDRDVAIKFLHGWMSLDVRARRRFEVEAQAMAKLRHPHCAQVLDFGLDGDTPYLVMELVEGETLGDLLERGPLPPPRAVTIARQALSALAHAHDRGITHRDIKPDNLMIGEATAVGDHVRILDFGIARLAEDGGALTAGMAIGTPKYMAPEQATGEGVDARTDLYAMAVVLYEMLAGEPPFKADETVEVLRMHREAPPPRVSDKAPQVVLSPALEAVLARSLAKAPAERFPDAMAFAEALAACPEASSPAPVAAQPQAPPLPASAHVPAQTPFPAPVPAPAGAPPARYRRAGVWLRRHPAAALTLAATLAALVVAVVVSDSPESEAAEATAAPAPSGAEPEALAEARELVDDVPSRAVKKLEAITREHGDIAEAWFLLGRAYFARMWWSDGLDAFRRAIELDDDYRTEPVLIETTLEGLVSRRAHRLITDFLADEVGPEARPYLEALAADSTSPRIRERAEAALDRF